MTAPVKAVFVKVDQFVRWYLDIIQTDAGTQFTSKEFQGGIFVRVVQLILAAPYYQEMDGEVAWRTLQTIAHSIMVRARVSDKCINFSLMYTTDHIFPVLPIKHLVHQYVEPTTTHKLE